MTLLWIRIRSWHALGNGRTLCGRAVNPLGEVRDTLPAEKSCETCLRSIARMADR